MKHHCTRLVVALVVCIAMPATGYAKAPAGRFVVDAKGETVHDTWGQRAWQRAVAGGSFTWAAAKTYCAGLALAGSGWRLPDVRELRGIVDRQQSNPAIDPTAFPSTPATWFWSATAYSGSSSIAWSVYFNNGDSGNNGITSAFRVRCVR